MNKTENLKLNVWEKSDPIHAKDFNDNFQTLDSAVQVCSKIAYGSYVGTGYNGENHPNRLDFADTLGTAPKIVFVISDTGTYQLPMLHGMTQQKSSWGMSNVDHTCYIRWTDTGIEWYNKAQTYCQMNDLGSTYYYVALA